MSAAHTPAASGDTGRPAFELTTYEDRTLARNQRLNSLDALVGHTIAHAFQDSFERPDESEVVLVTETGCWIVLQAESGDYEDEAARLTVAIEHEHGWERRQRGRPEQISDFISAQELLEAGLCSQAECDLLIAQKQAIEESKKQEKAARLRQQLADLEGGAA